MPYATQITTTYYHLVLTKGILRHTGLCNHVNDQTPLLYMEKRLGNSN